MDKPVDIEALKVALAKSTPGNWFFGAEKVRTDKALVGWWNVPETYQGFADSDYIEALQNAAPALLSELEALRAVRDAAKKYANLSSPRPGELRMELEQALAQCPGGGQ